MKFIITVYDRKGRPEPIWDANFPCPESAAAIARSENKRNLPAPKHVYSSGGKNDPDREIRIEQLEQDL